MRVDYKQVTRLCDLELGVGENPIWDDRTGRLLFEDIMAPALFRLDPETRALERWDMPATIGSFGLCADGRAIVALRNGVHLFDLATGVLEFLVHPEPDRPQNRLNDGKVGPDGRFWVGSMNDTPERHPTGALYRIDWDGTSTCMAEGLVVSNGLAWSADGRTMFHSDSRQKFITAYDYDLATGDIANRRVLATPQEADGRPDGAAADLAGLYWSAGVSAGCLNGFDAAGTLERKLILSVPAPTMPCFGGPDMKTLFVTSLSTERDGERTAGTVVSFAMDIAGVPVARFGERLPGF